MKQNKKNKVRLYTYTFIVTDRYRQNYRFKKNYVISKSFTKYKNNLEWSKKKQLSISIDKETHVYYVCVYVNVHVHVLHVCIWI